MDLSLNFDNSFSKREQFVWIGITSKQLGKLEAHHTYDIELEFVPLTCGLKVKKNIFQNSNQFLWFFLVENWWLEIN
jgi:hypothetical protein